MTVMTATAKTLTRERERSYVRELARQVAAAAATPPMEQVRNRWRGVNALRAVDRAPVWCRPVGCWKEILPPAALRCTDDWLRGLEHGFRRTLHKLDIGDDEPIEPTY